MKLESARALKQEIATQVVSPAVASIKNAGGFAITTFALSRVTPQEPLVALGIAPGKSENDAHLAVRLQRHSLLRSSAMLEQIHKRSGGEVDVRFVGRITPHQPGPWYQSRLRPLQPGCSVGHYKVTAGTIGALAFDKNSGDPLVLSNNHVLAHENAAQVGDIILQAGHFDGGRSPADMVGKLSRWISLVPNQPNAIDAAVAAVDKSIELKAKDYQGIGVLAGRRHDTNLLGLSVRKIGRTTGLTGGRISAIELDNVVVGYESLGGISFDNQIEIESTGDGPFSAGGDSGSLILDEDLRACALLFAGGETGGSNGRGVTYANPIGPVLDQLAIKLVGE